MEIPFDDFKKFDFRVGKILEAKQIPSSRNLIRMNVDFGSEKRQVVAGLFQWYQPKDLIG